MARHVDDRFDRWLAALEARHLADLRVAEVTRALRAVSSAYVERRASAPTRQKTHGVLDSAGKRAAFALFYAPLHFLTVREIANRLGVPPAPRAVTVDLGCGTGAAGAAWAVATDGHRIIGLDRHAWAVPEARWTYSQFGLVGRVYRKDAVELPHGRPGTAIVVAYLLNELADEPRARLERRLLAAAGRGASILVVEPIARAVSPWWEATARAIESAGGRADEWRLSIPLPSLVRTLDKAAGLDHRLITARSLYVAGSPTER